MLPFFVICLFSLMPVHMAVCASASEPRAETHDTGDAQVAATAVASTVAAAEAVAEAGAVVIEAGGAA